MSIDLLIATSALIAIAVVVAASLQGWNGWLALKRQELDRSAPRRPREPDAHVSPEVTARIELADLRERVRKLEAIASGVDL